MCCILDMKELFRSSQDTRTGREPIFLIVTDDFSNDVRHEKTDLKVFVIPKEGWARIAAPILLFAWHQLFENIYEELNPEI